MAAVEAVEGTKNILLLSLVTKFRLWSLEEETKPFKVRAEGDAFESWASEENILHNWWCSTSLFCVCEMLVPVDEEEVEQEVKPHETVEQMFDVNNEFVDVDDGVEQDMFVGDVSFVFKADVYVDDVVDVVGAGDDCLANCNCSCCCWVLSKLNEICVISLLLLSNWDL